MRSKCITILTLMKLQAINHYTALNLTKVLSSTNIAMFMVTNY